MAYEVVKAKSAEEAIAKSRFQVGDPAIVTDVNVSANSDGTYSVFPVCEPVEGVDAKKREAAPEMYDALTAVRQFILDVELSEHFGKPDVSVIQEVVDSALYNAAK